MRSGWNEVGIHPTADGLALFYRDVTERKEAEVSLRDTEERYRGLFQGESDAILLIDHESGRVLEANAAAEAMYGYSTGELLGLTDLDLSAEPELARTTIRSAVVGENVVVPSRMHRRKDGRAFPVEMTGRVFSLQGRPVRVVAVRDVSERERTEQERDRLLQSTRLLLDSAMATTSWADFDEMLSALGDLLLRSTAAHSRVLLELWDEERREVEIAASRGAGATPRQRFAFDGISDGAKQVITTRKTLVIDYGDTHLPDPQRTYVDEHAFCLVLVVPMVYRDRLVGLITLDEPGERRSFSTEEVELVEAIAAQAAAAIAHARVYDEALSRSGHLSDVFASMTNGFVSVDRSWRYTQVNPRAEELIGRPAAELLGLSMEELFPDMEGWPYYRKVMQERRAETFEVRSRPLGTWLEVHASPTAQGISILFADVSERRRLQDELGQAAAQRQVALDAASLVGGTTTRPRTSRYDEGYRKIFDVTGSERPNDQILERLHPDDLPGVWAKVEAALEPVDRSYAAEYRIYRSDGSIRRARPTALPRLQARAPSATPRASSARSRTSPSARRPKASANACSRN